MSVCSGLFSSQSISESHPGKHADRMLVDAQGAAPAHNARTVQALPRQWDLAPTGTLRHLDLPRRIFYPTAVRGHFARTDLGLPREAAA